MDLSAHKQKCEALSQLAKEITTNKNCWLFPKKNEIAGFFGTDPIAIVGDQPSKSAWDETHPHRRLYYDTLNKVGASNAHLTDLYKQRGEPSSLKNLLPDQLPKDFADHLKIFRRELTILKPTRIVALGQFAYNLLKLHIPELNPGLGLMWHFSYVWRSGKSHLYEAHMRRAIWKIQF
jgi:hypothetical protein